MSAYPYLDQFYDKAMNPKWEEFDRPGRKVHDWRTYVPEEVRAVWFDLGPEGMCAVVACCQRMADLEEWD